METIPLEDSHWSALLTWSSFSEVFLTRASKDNDPACVRTERIFCSIGCNALDNSLHCFPVDAR